MTDEQVYAGVEKALRKYFGKRGDRVVQDNLTCVKRGYSEMQGDSRGSHRKRDSRRGGGCRHRLPTACRRASHPCNTIISRGATR